MRLCLRYYSYYDLWWWCTATYWLLLSIDGLSYIRIQASETNGTTNSWAVTFCRLFHRPRTSIQHFVSPFQWRISFFLPALSPIVIRYCMAGALQECAIRENLWNMEHVENLLNFFFIASIQLSYEAHCAIESIWSLQLGIIQHWTTMLIEISSPSSISQFRRFVRHSNVTN